MCVVVWENASDIAPESQNEKLTSASILVYSLERWLPQALEKRKGIQRN